MYSGKKLGEAIESAIRKKGVKKIDIANEFGIKPPSVSGWLKTGRVSKEHLSKLLEYFSDVVEPSHFGIDNITLNTPQKFTQHHSGNGHNIGMQTINNYDSHIASQDKIKTLTMPDNSFYPIIPQGSLLTIDTKQVQIIDGKIYLIKQNGMEFIRRLFRQPPHIHLVVDNNSFPNQSVENIEIIGRVIEWRVID